MKAIFLTILTTLTISCANSTIDNPEFLVTKNSVGNLKKGMTVSDLLTIIPNENLNKVIEYDNYGNSFDDYQYFDNNKNHLLTVTPIMQNNLNSKINRILVLDSRFKTAKNIGLSSTYKDLKSNYEINEYSPDLEHIILTISEINAWFSVSKEQLLENWWNDDTKQIDPLKIPDNATFDTFVVWWE